MEDKKSYDLRFLHMRFIGKIIAGFTHEIKNYIAIIKESAGLIEDMIKLGNAFKSDADQYVEIIRSIEEQIEKTNSLFRYLNRFAHRMDNELSAFNVNESLEELIALLTRIANQKKISLEKDFQHDIPSITSNPSMLQFLVFHFLEENIARLDKNSRLIVKTAPLKNSIEVRIIPKGNFLTMEMEKEKIPDEILNNVIRQLGGSISHGSEEDTIITLPAAST